MRRGITLFAAAAASAIAISGAAYATVSEIGEAPGFTTPACVDSTCQVVTKVTAFQQQIGTKKNPFKIARSGKVVGVTLFVPEVGKKPYKFFSDKFDGAPTAKVAILRPRPRRGVPYRYVLAAQSANIDLSKYLGSTPEFALPLSLTVKKGDVVAVTTDSWLPAFTVVGQDAKTIWRASRPKKTCDDLTTERQHEKKGQIRAYACSYTGARLLYKVSVIDTPKKTS